ncbi:MAG: FAD:protein FMN transferase [Oscillospiraceae bacterium]|jgi:thiamine biosynthesis lipoprotein|nr:FAD:protein FMN transferase [Oscillospiraceae bacterium]
MKKYIAAILAVVILAGAAVLAYLVILAADGAFLDDTPKRYTGFAMGSVLEQTYWNQEHGQWEAERSERVARAVAQTEEELNAAREAPSELQQLMEASGGAFNPYLKALTALWNIDSKDGSPPRVPTEEEIQAALQTKQLDPGAYGKGMACDAAWKVLAEAGNDRLPLPKTLVNLGGNICALGITHEFRIALRDPKGGPNDTLGLFTFRGTRCISTSGSYEKYFEQGGKRYHHIFDPQTGRPAQRDPGLVSVTIVSQSGAIGDALSTACFVLGYEASLPLLGQYGADALFIYENGAVKNAGHARDYFKLQNNAYHWE